MSTAPIGASPIGVLIVEDDPLIAEGLAMVLEGLDIKVCGIAASAAAALAALTTIRPPDVALVDISLRGGMDGIDLAVALRRSGIPSILLSGQWSADLGVRAEAAQPLGRLMKPYGPQELMGLLDRHFQMST